MGLTVKEHILTCPWDHSDPSGGNFDLYARELIPAGGEDLPVLVYLQGGPGFPAPRPVDQTSGVIGEALKNYRVILLDQRGTGRSHRIDGNSPAEDRSVDRLELLRQEHIVKDAELLREALGITRWSLFGQSFGGFCITSYCSLFPESVEEAFLTGGLPTITSGIEDIYRTTFAAIRARHSAWYSRYPWADQRVREVAHHLDQSDETLPTGERLSARRFRTIGINLGRGAGLHELAYLLEDPFHQVAGEKRLRTDFLDTVCSHVSFAQGPLYWAIHESIYGGVVSDARTAWAAHRVREEIPGFEEQADPRSKDPYYLTGEHIFPWQCEEDPALRLFGEAAGKLAQKTWRTSPYDVDVLAEKSPTSAAAVYYDDAFVPVEGSMVAASLYKDCRVHLTNEFQHDGIKWDGAALFRMLREKVREF